MPNHLCTCIAIFSHLPTISELVLPSLVTYLVLSDRATWPRDLDLTGNEQPRDGARIILFAGWRAHRVGDMLLVGVMTRRRITCRRNGTKPVVGKGGIEAIEEGWLVHGYVHISS